MSDQLPAIPSASDLAADGEPAPPRDAFVLLTTPTLDLTREKIILIANDLRAKRKQFLQGKADKPPARAKAPVTAESKELKGQFVKGLLGQLKI